MITVREIIIFSVFAIVKCQYDYFRPDIRANELGQNIFGQPFVPYEENRSDEIPGKAGADYPIFSKIPETAFRCDQQRYPGYYADSETGCQAFHICQRAGRHDSFLCPNGTIFNQEWLVCDWWYNFDCSRAENLYSINEQVLRSMEEADTRLQDHTNRYYNDLTRYGNPGINGQFSLQNFPNVRDGFTPLNRQNILLNGPNAKYGVPGIQEFDQNSEHFKYNRGGLGFGRFGQRNGDDPASYLRASGFPGVIGNGRNLFRNKLGTSQGDYLPPGK